MATGSREVTEFQLQGEGMQVVFRHGDDECVRLEYNGEVFSGAQVRRETTVLGLAASVLVEAYPDSHTVFLTVVVPETHYGPDGRPVPVVTFAVLTTKRTSIAGPDLVSGQVDLYRVVSPLAGIAL